MKKFIEVNTRYMIIPVSRKQGNTRVELFNDGVKLEEFDLTISGECDLFATYDLENLKCTDFSMEGDFTEEWFAKIRFSNEKPNYDNNHKSIHYFPSFGWLNDPNGLYYKNGEFHIYHQYNPYGVLHGNMHWGYTKTKDFINFTPMEVVMKPDEDGAMFSGCGFVDEKDEFGFGKDTPVFFYTCAGGMSTWSKDKKFVQKLAYLKEGQLELEQSDLFYMEHRIHENRDPKVFYHKESKGYILVLFEDVFSYRIYRSDDLKEWAVVDEITCEGMWECPDLFCIRDQVSGETKWVFWSADGYYLLGEFDGYKFKTDGVRKEAYPVLEDKSLTRAYAAQTFANMGEEVLQCSCAIK